MKRYFVIAVLLIATASLGEALKPRKKVADTKPPIVLEQLVPREFGDWKVDPSIVPIAPAPDSQAKLDQIYDQVLARTYIDRAGRRVMLSVAYGGSQSDELKAHRQEVCYAAQGFEIKQLQHAELNLEGKPVPITRMLAVNRARSEPVTYWFTMGDQVVQSVAGRLVTQLKFGLLGEIPDGMLVRISDLSSDPNASFSLHDAFARDLVHHLTSEGRNRFIGAR